MVVLVLFVFILGLFFGSFLNVIIDRLPREESFWKGRSYCESCNHVLSPLDLFPLVSFAALRGKCRYCHTPLSYQYPLLELLTAVAFVLTFMAVYLTSPSTILFHLFIVGVLIVVFFIDLQHGIIPFKVVLPAIGITGIYYLFQDPTIFLTHAIAGAVVSAFFFLLFAGTKGKGMGFGDVVYAFFMGLLLGFPESIIGLYIAFLTGAVISLILILLKRKRLRGSTIPFGPFLVAGTFIALVYGRDLTNFVFRFI